jgi:ATP-binding cassette subfamily F protein uup
MEAHIHLKENEMSGLQAELLSPEVLSNSGKLVELTSKAATLQSEIERLYSRWAELEKKSQPQ